MLFNLEKKPVPELKAPPIFEFARNEERFRFAKWAVQAFGGESSAYVRQVKVEIKKLIGVNFTAELADGLGAEHHRRIRPVGAASPDLTVQASWDSVGSSR